MSRRYWITGLVLSLCLLEAAFFMSEPLPRLLVGNAMLLNAAAALR